MRSVAVHVRVSKSGVDWTATIANQESPGPPHDMKVYLQPPGSQHSQDVL